MSLNDDCFLSGSGVARFEADSSSPICLQTPLSHITTGSESGLSGLRLVTLDPNSRLSCPDPMSATSSSGHGNSLQEKHIPRPPNAFMLYRSDLFHKRVVPLEIEKRQQNISRIAGQCWRMLSEEEKAVWYAKAAAARADHHAKYPYYKFKPGRKATGGHPFKRHSKAKQGVCSTGKYFTDPAQRVRAPRSHASKSSPKRTPVTDNERPLPSSSSSPLVLPPVLPQPVWRAQAPRTRPSGNNTSQTSVLPHETIVKLDQLSTQCPPDLHSSLDLMNIIEDLDATFTVDPGFEPSQVSGHQMTQSLCQTGAPLPLSSVGLPFTDSGYSTNAFHGVWCSTTPPYANGQPTIYHPALFPWSPNVQSPYPAGTSLMNSQMCSKEFRV